MRSERVRRAAAKAAVTASEKTGRPVHPEVARLSRDSGTDTFVAEVQAAIVKSINTRRVSGPVMSVLSFLNEYQQEKKQ